jgi:hypothetical protein
MPMTLDQLHMSFPATDFSFNLAQLEDTDASVCDRMSAIFLSLNPAKTEFLLKGQPQKLTKLDHLISITS